MNLVPITSVKKIKKALKENLEYIMKSCSEEGVPVICDGALEELYGNNMERIGVIHTTEVMLNKDSLNQEDYEFVEVYVKGFEYKTPEEITIKHSSKVPALTESEERRGGLMLAFPDFKSGDIGYIDLVFF